jgi:sec-independent protein translocase protein TatA
MIGNLFDSPWKILLVAVVLIVLFGSKKLPHAARSLGQSMRILKREVKSLHEDDNEAPAQDGTSAPQFPQAQRTEAPSQSAQGATAPADQQSQIDALQQQIRDLQRSAATDTPVGPGSPAEPQGPSSPARLDHLGRCCPPVPDQVGDVLERAVPLELSRDTNVWRISRGTQTCGLGDLPERAEHVLTIKWRARQQKRTQDRDLPNERQPATGPRPAVEMVLERPYSQLRQRHHAPALRRLRVRCSP